MGTFEEEKQKQIDRIKLVAGGDYSENVEKELLPVQRQKEDFDFLTDQSRSQRGFYAEYKKKWNKEVEGRTVFQSQHVDPQEVEVQSTNYGFFSRYTRNKTVKNSKAQWQRKLLQYNATEESKKEGAIQKSIYGLKFTGDTGEHTLELMQSTLRFAAIEKRKKEIYSDVLHGKDEKEISPEFMKYRNQILALAPPLVADHNDSVTDDVHISKESEEVFRTFIEKSLENPVLMVKTAIEDAVHSYEDISLKLLDKDAIPQKFDVLKQLRDKYKAISTIVEKPMKGLFDSKEDEALADNFKFAGHFYKCLDMDLRYALEKNGMKFNENGKFLDKRDIYSDRFDQDGSVALKLLQHQYKNRVDVNDRKVDKYWAKELSSLISKEDRKEEKKDQEGEKKEEKKEEDNSDVYHIEGSIQAISQYRDSIGDKSKLDLFDALSDNAYRLSKAITDIDKELEDARDVYQRRAEEFKLRPELKVKMKKYLDYKRQQQLDLMDRAAGHLNAMRYLVKRDTLNVIGNRIMMEASLATEEKKLDIGKRTNKKKKVVVTEDDKDSDVLTEEEDEVNTSLLDNWTIVKRSAVVDPNSEGANADAVSLSMNVTVPADLKTSYFAQHQGQAAVENLKTMTKDYYDQLEDVYYKLSKNKNLSKMPAEERTDLVRQFLDVKKKLYTLNKIRSLWAPGRWKSLGSIMEEGMTDEEKKKQKDLRKLNEMKFKIASDMMETYRIRTIRDSLLNDTFDQTMLTESERAEATKLFAKYKEKNGAFEGNLGPQARLYKLFAKKATATRISLDAHRLEYQNFRQSNEEANNAEINRGLDRLIKEAEDHDSIHEEAEKEEKEKELKKKSRESILKRREEERQEIERKKKEELERREKERLEKEEKERLEKEKEEQAKKDEEERKKKEQEEEERKKKEQEEEARKKEEEEKRRREEEELKKKEDEEEAAILKKRNEDAEKLDRELKEIKEKKKQEGIDAAKKIGRYDPKFVKASKLKKKTVSIPEKKIPYSLKEPYEPETDSWAHSLASIINYAAGKAVVDGKELLTSKEKEDPEIFGEKRSKMADPMEMADLAFKYIPNTSMARTNFSGFEHWNKEEFINFVHSTLSKNKGPIILKRKGAFVTVYGIDKNNELICQRCSSSNSDDVYTEDPDVVFHEETENGGVSLYWLQELPTSRKDFAKANPGYSLDTKTGEVTAPENQMEQSKYQTDGFQYKTKQEGRDVDVYIPKSMLSKKEATEKVQKLETNKKLFFEPPIQETPVKFDVQEPAEHAAYENQGNTQYCWACAMSGLINFHAGKKVSDLKAVREYDKKIPKQSQTSVRDTKRYNDMVEEIGKIKEGKKVGNPAIYGDYIFDKVPGMAVKSVMVSSGPGKGELARRRLREELAKALQKGPVAILRNKHFVLCYGIDGDKIKVKNSLNDDPDSIGDDLYSLGPVPENPSLSILGREEDFKTVELVWLENIEGQEKEITEEYTSIIYDEEKKEFSAEKEQKPDSADSIFHQNGVESAVKPLNDVVHRSIYVPKKVGA